MGERADGRWASKFVGVSAPRQNGKSQLIVARALAGVLLFGEKMIIISAHETDTAREVWKRLIDVVEENPTIEARVTGRMDAINREYLSFGKGSERQTIRLKARRASGSRGFSADCLLLDEAQILGKQAWGSIVPTMSARPNPQLWLFGTPPTPEDTPFAFSRVRDSANAGKARHTWLEWAAEAGDNFNDAETWAKANPSFGVRITLEAVEDDRAAMDDDQFGLERLGIWPSERNGRAVIAASDWRDLADDGPADGTPPTALAVEMSHAREISVAACWAVEDAAHVEEVWSGASVPMAIDWIAARAGKRITVAIDGESPAAAMIPELRRRGVKVNQTNSADMAKGCGLLIYKTASRLLSHADQASVNKALEEARQRASRTAGGWVWDRREEAAHIAPVVAVTLALLAAFVTKKRSTGRTVFA